MIVSMLIVWFFIGVIFGIIEAWNKKVSFFIWVSCLIFSIFSLSNSPDGLDINKGVGVSNWWWILLIPIMWFGIWVGQRTYKEVFEK